MKKSCYIVHSVTRRKSTGQLLEVSILNAFETEEQAVAALRYEADVCRYEDEADGKWLDEYTFQLPDGYDPDVSTIVTYEASEYHDEDEGLFDYEADIRKATLIGDVSHDT